MTVSSPWISPNPTKLMIIGSDCGPIHFDLKSLTFFLNVKENQPKEGMLAAVWASERWYVATYRGSYWRDDDEHDFFDVEVYVPLLGKVPVEFAKTGRCIWTGDRRED